MNKNTSMIHLNFIMKMDTSHTFNTFHEWFLIICTNLGTIHHAVTRHLHLPIHLIIMTVMWPSNKHSHKICLDKHVWRSWKLGSLSQIFTCNPNCTWHWEFIVRLSPPPCSINCEIIVSWLCFLFPMKCTTI